MRKLQEIHVAGAGGHAKVVIATLQAFGFEVAGAWDDDVARVGEAILGVPVRGAIDDLPRDASIVVAIGSNRVRAAVVGRLPEGRFCRVTHPRAWVHSSVCVGAGTVLFAGVVVQPGSKLGEHVIVNTAASVDHDCVLEDFVHVGPGVRLAGNVVVRKGGFLGVGACALPGVEIGAWATVGAGAVVVQSLPAGSTAVGCPARPLARGTGR